MEDGLLDIRDLPMNDSMSACQVCRGVCFCDCIWPEYNRSVIMDGGGQDKWKHTRSLGTSLHLLRVRSCDGPRVGDRAVNIPSRSLSSAH